MIPYGRQWIAEEEIAAVTAVLTSDFLTQGPQVPAFEAALMDATGAAHAVAVNSATSALHIACLALGLGPGSLLWTSPNSFVASANVGLLCGADVDFVDIDPSTFNMCPQALAAKLETAERMPDLVMPVHFGGEPCDMPAIAALAARYGFKVIEDASHAVGARCAGAPVGACAHSDAAVFSFHPVKIVTTAEGGAALTQDTALAETMTRLRSHGVTRDPAALERPGEGAWWYEQHDLGLNYRMTDVLAALGVVQMTRLEAFICARERLAARYDDALADLPLKTQARSPAQRSALHLYPITLDAPERRRAVFDALRAAGMGVNVHYIPIHTQPFYAARGFRPGDFPNAERYYAGALSLPLYPALTDADQDQVIQALAEALS